MPRIFALPPRLLPALLCGLFLAAALPCLSNAGQEGQSAPSLVWRSIVPGLELAYTELQESKTTRSGALLVALRIDPRYHDFSLSMSSEAGQPRSFAEWSRHADLRAGINAGMYLPDKSTSTGYMRSGETVNNSNVGSRLGAFFMAGPRKKGLQRARILERDEHPGWQNELNDYDIVVQNYRFMDDKGRVLWRGGGPLHSSAVVAEDRKKRILFILSQEPLTAERFAWYLWQLPFALRTVMYVEGGSQAGLFLRLDHAIGAGVNNDEAIASLPGATSSPVIGGVVHVWKGRQSLLNTRGNPDAVLPNIIGVKR